VGSSLVASVAFAHVRILPLDWFHRVRRGGGRDVTSSDARASGAGVNVGSGRRAQKVLCHTYRLDQNVSQTIEDR
jgi:hypothetical protein